MATRLQYLRDRRLLCATFSGGEHAVLSAEYLRVFSPSAASLRRVVSRRRHVGILRMEPVGAYAVRIVFDDMHDSGIYSFAYLRELSENKFGRMRDYLRRLQHHGLSRSP